jgi:hypothetical protein
MSRDYFSRKKRGEKLYSIIKPYMEELAMYDLDTGTSIRDTFVELVTQALNKRAELEDIPPLLYKDKGRLLDYISRSEIHIVCQMIRHLLFNMGGRFNPAEIPSIFIWLADFGMGKDWDWNLFQKALLDSVGVRIEGIKFPEKESPEKESLRDVMKEIDYN